MANPSSANLATRPIRRQQLIGEAVRLIGQLGYRGFTVQALAEACGLTNAGVLHHFGTKDGLLLAVLDEVEREGRNRAALLVAALGDAAPGERRDATRQLLREMVAWGAEHAAQTRLLAALQAESMEPSHPAHGWFAQREAETLELFIRLVPHRGAEAESAARHLMALMQGLILQWLRANQGFDIIGEWVRAVDMVLCTAGHD